MVGAYDNFTGWSGFVAVSATNNTIVTLNSYTQLLHATLTHSSYKQQPLLPDGFKRNQGELRVSVYKVSGDQLERPLGSLRLKRIAATQESARYLADENP